MPCTRVRGQACRTTSAWASMVRRACSSGWLLQCGDGCGGPEQRHDGLGDGDGDGSRRSRRHRQLGTHQPVAPHVPPCAGAGRAPPDAGADADAGAAADVHAGCTSSRRSWQWVACTWGC
jgi:hypothetical protein